MKKCLIAAVCAVLFSGITFWLINCRASEIRFYDAFGIEHIYNASGIEKQKELMRIYVGDKEKLSAERERLAEIYNAALYVSGNSYIIAYWTDERPIPAELRERVKGIYEDYASRFPGKTPEDNIKRLQAEILALNAHIASIEECEGYGEYVRGIADSAENLLDISIYSGEGWYKNNIIKTKRDYYALESLEIQPVSEAGFAAAMCFRGADIAAAFLTLFIGLYLLSSLKTGSRRFTAVLFIWSAGVMAAYAVCYGISGLTFGLPEFGCTIQSLPIFRTCCYQISCGAAAIILIAFRLLGFAFFLFTGLFVFSRKKRLVPAAAFAIIISAEFLAAMYGGENRVFVFLREVNIFSAFSVERFFMRYLNLDIFSAAVSSLPVFILFFAAASAAVWTAALKGFTGYSRRVYAELQREYYDEIDRRYNESRKIRHDINNHLSVLQLLLEKGDTKGAARYIGEISESLDMAIMPVKTGSDIVDALLCVKSNAAKENGAALEIQLDCPLTGCGVSDYELCGIFGNIIDNALEAVKTTDDRAVKLFIGKQHDMLMISCENRFSGELKRSGNTFRSTKAEPAMHGLGLSRVREITRENGGDVRISVDDNRFRIEILLSSE